MDQEDIFLKKKQEIEKKIKNDWQLQKNEILKLEEDQNNDYQSIIKQIKESKNKTRKLQKTLDDHEKDVKQQQKDFGVLLSQKKEKTSI